MAYGLVGLYGLYLIFVGYKGNASNLMQYIQSDGKGFIPWIIAIAVLSALYKSDAVRPVIKPFVFLAIMTFVLKNWPNIADQINKISGNPKLLKG